MIKWPEPVAWRTSFNNGKRWVPTDVEAISDALHGLLAEPLYTEAQLKQAVRDALEEALSVAAQRSGVKPDPMWVCEGIRALIKEIPK
jgi:hypothetical protein